MGKKIDPKVAVAIMLKAKFKPLEPYTYAMAKWKCLHIPCENIVYPQLSKIKQGRKGCKFCQNWIPPEIAMKVMLEAKIKPKEKYQGSDKPWKSTCLVCKNEIFPRLSGVKRGKGCKYCLKRYVDPSEAVKFMQKRNLIPYEQYKNANTPWKCKCLICGEDVNPSYYSIRSGRGCASCAGNQIRPNDAVAVMLKANLQPQEAYKDGQKKWKCICSKCGKIVYPTYSSVQQGQGGCKYCATFGFNVNVPSYLYLITHSQLGAHKVGIGNSRNASKKNRDRLGKFRKFGWELHKVWDFETGEEATKVESAVFQVLKNEFKLTSYLSREQMPITGGETETVNADSITLLQLEKIINKVIKEYKK